MGHAILEHALLVGTRSADHIRDSSHSGFIAKGQASTRKTGRIHGCTRPLRTFRDIYRTDTLAISQRLKILSLTFLFSDLKGSTKLYERVGDLVAFDLVNEHFRLLQEIITSERGAVVKTIGDAVMATFETPDRDIAAAIRMREAMSDLGAQRQHQSLRLKIDIHEGSCLAAAD
jgi:class 3 adenylate cyclase